MSNVEQHSYEWWLERQPLIEAFLRKEPIEILQLGSTNIWKPVENKVSFSLPVDRYRIGLPAGETTPTDSRCVTYSPKWWAERLPFIEAYSQGNRIDINLGTSNNPDWVGLTKGTAKFDGSASSYRVAPKPKLIPWNYVEVPIGGWIRRKDEPEQISVIIGKRRPDRLVNETFVRFVRFPEVLLNDSLEVLMLTADALALDYEHSMDCGNTWNPCGKLEKKT